MYVCFYVCMHNVQYSMYVSYIIWHRGLLVNKMKTTLLAKKLCVHNTKDTELYCFGMRNGGRERIKAYCRVVISVSDGCVAFR